MAVNVRGSKVPSEVRESAEQLIYEEARLLDTWDLEGWLSLYTADCTYWVPVVTDEYQAAEEPSLLLANYNQLRTLVDRFETPFAHSQTPRSRFKRIVGNIRCQDEGTGNLRVFSNFILCESRLSVERVIAGEYEHLLIPSEDSWKISFKRASMINSHQAMYNLSMFFI